MYDVMAIIIVRSECSWIAVLLDSSDIDTTIVCNARSYEQHSINNTPSMHLKSQ